MPAVLCSLTPVCFLLALLCVFACLFVVAALSHLTAATAGAVDEPAVAAHTTAPHAAGAEPEVQGVPPAPPPGGQERGGAYRSFWWRYFQSESLCVSFCLSFFSSQFTRIEVA